MVYFIRKVREDLGLIDCFLKCEVLLVKGVIVHEESLDHEGFLCIELVNEVIGGIIIILVDDDL